MAKTSGRASAAGRTRRAVGAAGAAALSRDPGSLVTFRERS
jgi:hypothetical protein